MVSENDSNPKAWSCRYLRVKKFHRLRSGGIFLLFRGRVRNFPELSHCPLFCLFFFLVTPCCLWDLSSQPRVDLGPRQWNRQILTTGLPGKSLFGLMPPQNCHGVGGVIFTVTMQVPAWMLNCSSHVWLFATTWTVAHQAPLSMGFFRQEYWSGLSFPPPGNLPESGIEPASPELAGRFFTTSTTWEALQWWYNGPKVEDWNVFKSTLVSPNSSQPLLRPKS